MRSTRMRKAGRPRFGRTVAAFVGALLTSAPLAAQAPLCGDGLPPRAGIGVGRYHCTGGSCRVWTARAWSNEENRPAGVMGGGLRTLSREERSRLLSSFDFTIQPELREIDPYGPAAGRLQEGDVLLAVDGLPITSSEAGRRLGDPDPDRPLTLTVERDGELHEVRVEPSWSCAPLQLSAGPTVESAATVASRGVDTAADVASPTAPSLGLELRCRIACVSVLPGEAGGEALRFSAYPTVGRVVEGSPAEEAGVREGDRLIRVDGLDLLTLEGAAGLADLRPGERVELVLLREGAPRILTVHIPGR